MAYKKNIFKDRTVITLSAISIIAAAALIGGIALDSGSDNATDTEQNVVDLNESGTETTMSFTQNNNIVEDNSEAEPETEYETETSESITEETSEFANESTDIDQQDEISVNAQTNKLNFTVGSILTWPVDGNIVIDYDMNNTVYFPTLDLYKCSDSICIGSDVGTPVYASTTCVVKEVSTSDEIGSYVVLDLGNEYALTYGQLKDIVVNTDDALESGDLIGYVNEPSAYYTVEGPNLYLKLTENGNPVNPLDYLNYEQDKHIYGYY